MLMVEKYVMILYERKVNVDVNVNDHREVCHDIV